MRIYLVIALLFVLLFSSCGIEKSQEEISIVNTPTPTAQVTESPTPVPTPKLNSDYLKCGGSEHDSYFAAVAVIGYDELKACKSLLNEKNPEELHINNGSIFLIIPKDSKTVIEVYNTERIGDGFETKFSGSPIATARNPIFIEHSSVGDYVSDYAVKISREGKSTKFDMLLSGNDGSAVLSEDLIDVSGYFDKLMPRKTPVPTATPVTTAQPTPTQNTNQVKYFYATQNAIITNQDGKMCEYRPVCPQCGADPMLIFTTTSKIYPDSGLGTKTCRFCKQKYSVGIDVTIVNN